MDNASVEIENRTGKGGVIVARFETSADTVGTMHIAGGARQRFEKFDRLTVTAPDAAGHLRLFNHSPWPLDLLHETQSGHKAGVAIATSGFQDLTVVPGDQLYIVPHTPAFVLPPPPLLHFAQFHPISPPRPFPHLNKPTAFAVFLEWIHPMEGKPELSGYNVYRSVYRDNYPVSLDVLNGVPQRGTSTRIVEVQPVRPYNHRYAITAVNSNAVESLFSNIRILDWRTRNDLFDAGFIPL